jgi:hypothetical protein
LYTAVLNPAWSSRAQRHNFTEDCQAASGSVYRSYRKVDLRWQSEQQNAADGRRRLLRGRRR